MNVVRTHIPDVLILEPKVHGDSRGFFLESWNEQRFNEAVGRPVHFVQDNHSHSAKGVLRGLHYQLEHTQGKLVRVTHGRVFDVAVDLRRGSRHFGQHVAMELSGDNQRQAWMPEGFAHGFLVLSESADFLYKTTDFYHSPSERTILWSDRALDIQWPLHELNGTPQLAMKDRTGRLLADSEVFR